MPNLYNYRPALDLELSVCKNIDCKSVKFTDVSPIFLEYGLNWLVIKKIEIDVYVEDTLISTNDVTNQFFTDITGTISAAGTDTSILGSTTAFESEIASLDYVVLNDEFYYQVSDITDGTNADFNTIPDAITGASAKRIYPEFTLDASSFGGAAGDAIEDDVYTFVYRVTYDYTWDNDGISELVEDEETTDTFTEVLYCQTLCCVKKKLAALANNIDCCVESNDIMDAMLAWAWIESLEKQAGCANVEYLTTTLDLLKEYCLDTPCNC